jgi:aminoglycoside phosphotransferase (APT) family kinase protein
MGQRRPPRYPGQHRQQNAQPQLPHDPLYDGRVQPWDAERPIDLQAARALIDAAFPSLAGLPLRPFGEGWDNSAFLAGDWVFRFPRRKIAVPLLERECDHLPHLQQLPLKVPNPELVGRSPDGWPFAGYRCLPGHPAVGVGEEIRRRAAAPLGAFVRALHATPPPAGMVGDTLGRLDVAAKAPRLQQAGLSHLIPPPPGERPRVLCHGDLYSRHLLIDEGGLCGVIDWGDLHLGDPAVDLMVMWSFLPADARADFLSAYGAVDDEMLRLARFRAVFHSLALRDYAVDHGDPLLVAEAERALRE